MKLYEILNNTNIEIIDKANHKDVIEKLLKLIAQSDKITDHKILSDAIKEREKIISTGIGLGLAIPHARSEVVKDFTASIVLLQKGTDWKSIDDKPVKIAILIASPPNTHREYLGILSQTVLNWKEDSRRRKILSAKTPEDIYQVLKELNI